MYPYILPYGIHYLTEHMGQASCTMIVIPARPCFHWDLNEPSCLGGCTSAPWLGGLLQVHAVVQGRERWEIDPSIPTVHLFIFATR
jgi:hypothetical protein